jgi:hypothetical protein
MRNLTYILILTGILFGNCHKHPSEPLIINPTVNPITYSVLVYLITPKDQSFNSQYYRSVKSSALSLQNWYKAQMGNNKTFMLNPVVVDTLTGLHNSSWYNSNNGPSISGTGLFGYHNTFYEMQQLLGGNFSTTKYTYFIFVAAAFPDETIPKGLAAEGSGNLAGLTGKNSNKFIGAAGHALGHAFGLPELAVENADAIMSTGYPKYPNCILRQVEKDSLNVSPFFEVR